MQPFCIGRQLNPHSFDITKKCCCTVIISIYDAKHFGGPLKEQDCRAALERIRWPEGPKCPHCDVNGTTITPIGGTSHRPGLYLCSECRKQFTVTVGTPLEGSKLPLASWLQAAHMLNTLSKVVTVREVEKALGVTYKTAWHMVQQKLLKAVESYRGPLRVAGLPIFGSTVNARIEPLLPPTRNTLIYWRRRKRAGTYKAPQVPAATGALSGLQFTPPATKAHVERTERFVRWVLTA